jgi:hypothetical protein
VIYTCEGCGIKTEATPEEAFEQGWDTPERFMAHCTCPKCPITTTLWWRLVIEKQQTVSEEEAALLVHYNDLFKQYNETQL